MEGINKSCAHRRAILNNNLLLIKQNLRCLLQYTYKLYPVGKIKESREKIQV